MTDTYVPYDSRPTINPSQYQDPTKYTADDFKKMLGWNGTKTTVFDFPENLKKDLNFKDQQNKQQDCPVPEDPPMKDSVTDISSLLKAAGGDQKCIKDTDLYNKTDAGSVRGKADAIIASAEFEAKYMSQTTNERKRQEGCGTLLVTATNIIQKRKAMMCVVNKCKQDTTISASAGASVIIQTVQLTPEEIQSKQNLQDQITQQTLTIQSNDAKIVEASAKNLDSTKFEMLTKFLNDRAALTTQTNNAMLDLYRRDVVISKSAIKVKANVSINTKVVLSSDAKSSLSAISEDITKDTAAMAVANELGVNAQDPSVRSIVNRNLNKSDSTASSSITNLSQNTSVSADAQGRVVITCPGTIRIMDSEIGADAVANVIVEQMIQQAITNGMDLASKTLNDTSSVQDILNKVRGLDDYQKAVNEALKAALDASPNFGQGALGKYLPYILAGIGGVIVLGGIAYMLKSGGGGGGGGQPIIQMTPMPSSMPSSIPSSIPSAVQAVSALQAADALKASSIPSALKATDALKFRAKAGKNNHNLSCLLLCLLSAVLLVCLLSTLLGSK